MEYLILLVEVMNGVNIILASYKVHWQSQLNVQAIDISPLHYSLNYPSILHISSQITFLLNKALRWIWIKSSIILFLFSLNILFSSRSISMFIYFSEFPSIWLFSLYWVWWAHGIKSYSKYFTFSRQLLKKLEFDLLCKIDYSDKWSFYCWTYVGYSSLCFP